MPGDDFDLREKPPYSVSEFTCHRCGNCCKGDGIVVLTDDETRKIAGALELAPPAFLERFTRITKYGERVLLDKIIDGEKWCVFLERGQEALYACSINGAKPRQCRDFPMKWRTIDAFRWCEGLKSREKENEQGAINTRSVE